jgi:nucleotide-binding universal stress UspA family protein
MVDGFADTALADTARELNADLIVVGSHGRTGVARVLLGSVGEKTVRFASASVLVARGDGGVAEGGFRRIVVGTDFSALADGAIARALEVATTGADVHLVHAWHVPPAIGPETVVAMAELRDALAEDAERRAGELRRAWKGRGREVRFHVETVEAPAQQALVERAEALGADLIVVGSHGRRGVRRLVLGSVAETTARHAPCSVLVAR